MPLANLPSLKVEAAFGDTPLDTSQSWTDISSYVLSTAGVTVDRGRQDEAQQFSPGRASLTLANRTRVFDPLHGPACVTLTGAISTYVSTPDTAAVSLTTDLEAVWIGSIADWTPTNTTTLCGKWNPTGNQRSWQLRLTTGGILRLVTSALGDTTLITTDCTAAVPFSSGRYAVKVTLDADNGSGSNVVKFWYGTATANEEPASWTQLGSTVTTGGVRAIYDSTATLDIGTVDTTATTYPFIGSCNRFILRSSIGGTIVADFNGRDWVYGATTCTSSATAEVWTLQGAATATVAPYYERLLPRVQLRISAVWSAVTYRIWQGHAVGWPQRGATGNKNVTVPLEGYDALAWLSEAPLGDPLEDLAASAGTVAGFLRQCDGTTWTDAEGGTDAFPMVAGVLGDSLCSGSDSPSVVFDDAAAWVWPSPRLALSLSFWVQTTTVGASSSVWDQIFGINAIDTYEGSRIGIDSSGRVCGETSDYNPTFFSTVRSSVSVNDGLPHHVMFVNDAGTVYVYVDGVDVTSDVGGTGGAGNQWPCEVIGAPSGAYVATSGEFVGSLQDICAWSTVVSAANVLAIYRAGINTIRESTTTRAGRVLDAVGWPSAWRSLTSAPYGTCAATYRPGDSALNHLQLVAATECGRMFANKTNQLTLHPRYWHQTDTNGTTSQATFSDDGAGVNYQMVGTNYSDIGVVTSCTVSGSAGSATSTDSTAVAAYGLQTLSISTLLPTVAECQDYANGMVYWWGTPTTRSTPIVVMPGAQTSKWATVLGLEIGDRITVEWSPYNVGAQTVLTLLIESISWDISGDNWVQTITASPVPSSFLVLDTDVLDTGRLGF